MVNKNLLEFVEDKQIILNENWYYHATKADITTIKKILDEGIKCAYLRGLNGNHFNGKYYISLCKRNSDSLFLKYQDNPKFIIEGIKPHYAYREKYNLRKWFINTKVPLRTSEWDGEFQEYLIIKPSKIIAIEYSLSTVNNLDEAKQLYFLKSLLLVLKQRQNNLPIIDALTSREINKEKVLSLHL